LAHLSMQSAESCRRVAVRKLFRIAVASSCRHTIANHAQSITTQLAQRNPSAMTRCAVSACACHSAIQTGASARRAFSAYLAVLFARQLEGREQRLELSASRALKHLVPALAQHLRARGSAPARSSSLVLFQRCWVRACARSWWQRVSRECSKSWVWVWQLLSGKCAQGQ
jgi:hypothetical protein